MKYLRWVLGLMVIFSVYSFSPAPKKRRKKDKAMEAYQMGDYSTALTLWNKSIAKYESRHKEQKCPFYTHAGIAAFQLHKIDEARTLLEHARYGVSENAQTFDYLAKVYRKIDNLSLEIDALENYVKKYPGGKNIQTNKRRLLHTYVESENWDKILSLWQTITPLAKDSISYQGALLSAQGGLGNTKAADSLASKLLAEQPDNLIALEWIAKKYYTLAENTYESEMEAYKVHHTRSQYNKLLKAFDGVTVHFKRSLIYYKKLYRLQSTAETAQHLVTIYMRLDDKPKADYYLQMVKKLKK